MLNKGDMAYYVNLPHRRFANASADRPLLLIVITAPPTSSLDELTSSPTGQLGDEGRIDHSRAFDGRGIYSKETGMFYDEFHNHKWARNLKHARQLLAENQLEAFYNGEDLPEGDVYPACG